jgi:hypothetical protein
LLVLLEDGLNFVEGFAVVFGEGVSGFELADEVEGALVVLFCQVAVSSVSTVAAFSKEVRESRNWRCL